MPCAQCNKRGDGVFCTLPENTLSHLDASKSAHQYETGQTLFHQGNDAYGLYYIQAGKIKIYETDNEGNQQIIKISGEGDMVGYDALLSNTPHPNTAEVIEASKVCFIPKSTFLQLISEHAPTHFKITQQIARELSEAQHRLTQMAHKNVRERFAEVLLRLGEKHGLKTAQGTIIQLHLSRQTLAEFIGSSQESVIRLVTEFKRDELITEDEHFIILINMPGLIKTSGA